MSVRLLNGVLLTIAIALGSCAPQRGPGDAPGAARVPLVVENQNFYQATIFAISNSHRVRVGEVPGNSTATLEASSPPTGRLSVEVRLLAVGAFTSHPVSVAPGDTVRIVVPPDLHRRRGRPR